MLQIKHFMFKNRDSANNLKKADLGFGMEVNLEVAGMAAKFNPPTNVTEIIMALQNLDCAYYQLYPWDWTPKVLSRVALTMNNFSQCKDPRVRVTVFEDFINDVLRLMKYDTVCRNLKIVISSFSGR